MGLTSAQIAQAKAEGVTSALGLRRIEKNGRTMNTTPGPWIIRDRTGTIGNPAMGIEGPGAEVVASVIYQDGFGALQANARLIAAAPDLLAACKAALDGLYSYRDIPGNASAMAEKEQLERAIKQAEGEV